MDKHKSFNAIVANLHAAALDPKLWAPSLSGLVTLLKLRVAHFFLWNSNTGRVDYSVCEMPTDHAEEIGSAHASYTNHYASIDYRRDLTDRTEAGVWMHCHAHTSAAKLAKNSFFQEFLRPARLRWLSGLRVTHVGDRIAYFGLSRGFDQQPIDGDDLRIVESLSDHLVVASRNFFSASELRVAAQQGLDSLNACPEAVVLLDAQAHARFVNKAAERFLRTTCALRVRPGVRVTATDGRNQQQLQNAIRRALVDGLSSSFPLMPKDGAAPWPITVLPLAGELADKLPWVERHALVMIGGVTCAPKADALCWLLGLTPGESELALALLHGETPVEVAVRRKVSVATVRSQIRNLFNKTGVNRISALIRLLSTLTVSPSPSPE